MVTSIDIGKYTISFSSENRGFIWISHESGEVGKFPIRILESKIKEVFEEQLDIYYDSLKGREVQAS